MTTTLFIDRRFCGPPNSANGGYICGLIDRHTDFTSEVTLHKPPPLMKDMPLLPSNGGVALMDGDVIIAGARPGTVDFSAPPPPDFPEAETASRHFIGFSRHPFPTCFVCGPERATGDGLRIFAGQVDGRPVFAAPWTPDASLAGEDGLIKREFLWAALDCPGAFAIMGDQAQKIVLGRMTAAIEKEIRAGEQCIVIAWKKGSEGRKHFCGTAIYNTSRELCAVGDAVWISLA